jgi:hypothetical protein
MRILFHNYSTAISTEPLYLSKALKFADVEAAVWSNARVSAYDMFDGFKPDVFVTHFQHFSNDVLTYLKNNNKFDVVLNVTGATESQLKYIESCFNENSIKCPFIFSNSFDDSPKTKLKFITMYPAADIFNRSDDKFMDHGVPEAIISDNFSENLENLIGEKEVFHLLYITEKELDSHFDMRVNALTLSRYYNQYPKITLVGDKNLCCSQLCLDLALNAKDFEVKCSDVIAIHDMSGLLFSQSENDNVKEEMKNQIKAKHTPFHRAWRFMKYLENKEAMSNLEKIKTQLPELLKLKVK